jgi:16S rRNA (adenine1518-N6/adenine1519-N6)-dimethyltransferase
MLVSLRSANFASCAGAPAVDPKLLGAVVTSAFSQRRKLLRHSLGRWLAERGYEGHFDLQRRAEEVPVDEFIALALAVPQQK